MSDSNFYKEFEARFYAPREYIKDLRRQYLPFIECIAKLYPNSSSFDIGCGRGEWLELMQEAGLKPFGLDLDAGMLESCVELNLPAEQGNAVDYLETLASESQSVITAFHVVEHIAYEQLESVIKNSLRVLKPGGILIMETPNPENISVATRNFYLDPTHIRPIPSGLLAFLAQHRGFAKIHTLRLQERKELHDKKIINLFDVINGVSPDYAVIAQKSADQAVLAEFHDLFERPHGISIDQMLERYDQSRESELKELRHRMEDLLLKDQDVRSKIIHLEEKTEFSSQFLTSELQKNQLRSVQQETLIEQLNQQLLQSTERYYQNEKRISDSELRLHEALSNSAQWAARHEALQLQQAELLKHNQQLNQQLQDSFKTTYDLQFRLENTEQKLSQAIELESEIKARVNQLTVELDNTHQSNHRHWSLLQEAQQRAQEALGNADYWHEKAITLEKYTNALHKSTSWRITAPIRGLRHLVGWALYLPVQSLRLVLRFFLKTAIRLALKHNIFHKNFSKLLLHFPRLNGHLKKFSIHRGIISETSSIETSAETTHRSILPAEALQLAPPPSRVLAPRAKKIYQDILLKIKN